MLSDAPLRRRIDVVKFWLEPCGECLERGCSCFATVGWFGGLVVWSWKHVLRSVAIWKLKLTLTLVLESNHQAQG
jgi:hypothetical protein